MRSFSDALDGGVHVTPTGHEHGRGDERFVLLLAPNEQDEEDSEGDTSNQDLDAPKGGLVVWAKMRS
jgi:hypothetical protein